MTAATAFPRRKPTRTLVLNADYRPLSTWPLSVVPVTEAISTVWRDRADVVEVWPDAVMRSPSTVVPLPKIIALRRYVHIDAAPKFCRRSILLRDRYRCQYCGKQFPGEELTFDHVIPRSAGGQTVWDNILSACVECNTRKRNAMPNYSGQRGSALRPLKPPRQPSADQLLRAGLEFLDQTTREDFGSFLYWDAELKP